MGDGARVGRKGDAELTLKCPRGILAAEDVSTVLMVRVIGEASQ